MQVSDLSFYVPHRLSFRTCSKLTGIQFQLSLELDISVFVFLSLGCTLTLLISIITVHTERPKSPPSMCGCSVAKSCLTLFYLKDGSLPGSSVHEIFQAKILEWVAISFSGDLPDPGIEPWDVPARYLLNMVVLVCSGCHSKITLTLWLR